MINIGLVDDNEQILELLSFDLGKVEEFNVVLKASNGQDFIRKAKQCETKPHLVLMDVDMPRMDGIEAVKEGKQILPHTYFIMFSVMDEEETLFKAVRAGAHGYILKEEPIERIISRLKDVMEFGSIPFSPLMANKALNLVKWAVPPISEKEEVLTNREKQILEMLSDGKNSNEIADELYLSFHTVRKHIRNIYDKLQVKTQAEAVKKGFLKRWLGY